MENEELDEIDYYEIVSLDEIVKFNPTFVAFSNDEIYNNLFQFFKSSTKAENFLRLFTEIIDKQKNQLEIKNFIIVADAKRGNFSEKPDIKEGEENYNDIKDSFMINEFINKIKNSNKDQVKLAFKNKNKLWFPLIYDEESSKIKFRSNSISIIELGENDNYVIFKDDDRDIPIMGVYFYEPIIQDNDNLNNKIVSFLITDREKGEFKSANDFKSFNDLISSYKIKIPLDKIDEDDYNYLSLNNLLKKYNYDLDYISIKDFEILKTHLNLLQKKEIKSHIKYSIIKNKPIILNNNRFIFYSIIKKTFNLIDITLKSAKKIQKDLDDIKNEKSFIEELPIHKDLSILIENINNDNYSDIINNLRDIRKNLSITNCITALENYLKINIDDIKQHFDKLENRFKLLMVFYKDLYDIKFTFEKEENEIKLGNDTKDYEGIPLKIDEYKKNTIYIDDNDDDDVIIEEVDKYDELNKYYNNYYYNLEKGFSEALKIILPFIVKMQELSHLPINLGIICNHLFNIHRGIPEKYALIREKYRDKYDEDHCKEEAKKSISFVMMSNDIDNKLKEANIEYIKIITDILYDVICKWSIELQRELLEETLLYSKNFYHMPCIHLWDEYGAPYNMESKKGIIYYLICIFEDAFKEFFSENDINYLPFDENNKNKIIIKLNENYKEDLKQFQKTDKKKIKENKGLEAQKKLVKYLQDKNYKDDKFFETFIESLIYYPSVKYKKIHKYLLGCCLEKIDNDFTADKFFKTDRTDLEKAKSKFSNDRVLNKKRYLRFYLSKLEIFEKKKDLSGIKYESLKYPIYEKSLEQWFNKLDDSTILSKSNINDIRVKLLATYKIHIEDILNKLDKDKKIGKLIREKKDFKNYRQILIGISTILFQHLKEKAMTLIYKINKTIEELDKLNSIINDDNETDINQILTIIIIRAICLPAFPDIKKIDKLESYNFMNIEKSVYINIYNDIKSKIIKIIENNKMPTENEVKDYINKFREDNKNKILSKYKNKTIEEKAVFKELKKCGIDIIGEDDENIGEINKEKTDIDLDNEGQNEFTVRQEDPDIDDDNMDDPNYGFYYA